jgi:hypothetical protein
MILSIGIVCMIISLLSFIVVDNFGNCVPERKIKLIIYIAIIGIALTTVGVLFAI